MSPDRSVFSMAGSAASSLWDEVPGRGLVASRPARWKGADMAKWADYVIFRVRFNTAGTHIDQVEVADDGESQFGPKRTETRATVVTNRKAGETPITAP